MTRSERLEPVVEYSESTERAAARALAQARQALAEQERKLAELEGYLAEYEAQLGNERGGAVSADRLQEYQCFMSRLNAAIARQAQRVGEAQRLCEARRQAWLAARTRVQALGKVVERLQGAERREAERAEQRESDERSRGMSTARNERDET
jgi:flagellar FliJ protein